MFDIIGIRSGDNLFENVEVHIFQKIPDQVQLGNLELSIALLLYGSFPAPTAGRNGNHLQIILYLWKKNYGSNKPCSKNEGKRIFTQLRRDVRTAAITSSTSASVRRGESGRLTVSLPILQALGNCSGNHPKRDW